MQPQQPSLQAEWIADNVMLLAASYDRVVFDDDALTVEVGPIALPAGWEPAQILVKIPIATCPYRPPYPLYVPAGLTKHGRKPHQYLSGPDDDGWCKFHVGIAEGWTPTWSLDDDGDTLVTYLRTIRHALTEGIAGGPDA